MSNPNWCPTCNQPYRLPIDKYCARCAPPEPRPAGPTRIRRATQDLFDVPTIQRNELEELLIDFSDKSTNTTTIWLHGNPDHTEAIRANYTKIRSRCRKYGITITQWIVMVAANGSRCAICDTSYPPTRLHIDHDHHTGHVRGLLCSKCNTGLGQLGVDGPDAHRRIRNITRYLNGEAFGTRTHADKVHRETI